MPIQAEPLYTELACHAVELSKLFALFVANPPIPTATGAYAIELMTPHGPSTGNGAHSLQHITFVQGDRTIVVGSVDQVAQTIEIRGYAHVAELYTRRYDRSLPFAFAPYEAFIRRVRGFANSQHYTVVLVELAPALPPAPAPVRSPWMLATMIAAPVAAAAALVIAWL